MNRNSPQILRALSLCLSLLWVAPLYAASYYVAPISGDSADPALRSSVRELIITSLRDKGQQIEDAPRNADFQIEGQVIMIGQSVVLVLQKFGAEQILYSDRMKAQRIEEIDTIVGRLVEAALLDQNVESTVKIGEISDREMTLVQKRTATRNFELTGIGPFKFINLDTELLGYHIALGSIREVTPNAAIRTVFEGTFRFSNPDSFNSDNKDSESIYLASMNIGGLYYFTSHSTSPYISGSFGYGGAYSTNTETSWGLTVGAEVGIAWFRTASSQMQLGLKYMMLANENQIGNPQSIGLALSILH
jgi:hypothetical protein